MEVLGFILEAAKGKHGFLWYSVTFGPLVILVTWLILIPVRKIYKKLRSSKRSIHLLFFERLIQVLIVISAIFVFVFRFIGTEQLWHTLFGSTVVIGGIIGIAGQDVLKDILAGIMISIYKPFDVGDRLYISDIEKSVIVEDITMHHVVLRARDGMHYIMPNSEINKKTITHSNYDHGNRATYLRIPVSYNADLREAIKLIRQAVKECPYTCPNNWKNKDLDGYGDAYLVSILDSAMLMETTIWSEPGSDNDLAVSEAYQGIIRSFARNGIEIPYNFMNIIKRENENMFFDENQINTAIRESVTRTDTLTLGGDIAESVRAVVEEASKFSEFHGLRSSEQSTVELLSEELISFMNALSGEMEGRFWIEGNRQKINIHLRSQLDMTPGKKSEVLNIARAGKNSVMLGLAGRLRDMIHSSMSDFGGVSFSLKKNNELKKTDGLEKLLITKLSDDVMVSVMARKVEVVVVKKFSRGGKD